MKTALHELVLAAGCALFTLCGYETALHAATDQATTDRILAVVEPGPTAAREIGRAHV